jgi:hypothetical protein
MDQHHAAGHASADDEYLETPPGSTYEHTDATIGIIVKFLFWLAVSAVAIHIGLGLMYALLIDRAMETGQPRYPLAAAQGERLPPAPRLQQEPRNEFRDFRRDEQGLLEGYGWINKGEGIVHIPIEEAMRLTIARGALSSRAADNGERETPGLMPSDSSAGRVVERRRQ